jgi:hypothetical protein
MRKFKPRRNEEREEESEEACAPLSFVSFVSSWFELISMNNNIQELSLTSGGWAGR